MKRNFLILFVSLLVLVMGFTQISFAQLAVDIPRNETLIVDILSGRAVAPDNFNVFASTWRSPDRGVHHVMLEPLWMDEYATGEIVNALAAEGPIYNEDFTQMTVKLREGCFWSDGVPITADDIVYGVETAMSNPSMSYNAQFSLYIDKVYKTDDYTVVFELKEPNSRFHTNFLDRWGCWSPFPKHIFEKVEGDPAAFDFNPPISSGPYVLKDYDSGGYWTLWELREDWERTPTGMLFGMPKPKYALFYAYPQIEQRVIAQASNNLDMGELTLEALRAVRERNPYVRPYRKEFPWIIDVDPCVSGLTLNNDIYPYNLKDVRWALTLAIDIVDYAAIGWDGAVILCPLHLPATPNYQKWYYEPMKEWLENFTLDIEVDGEPFKPYDSEAPLKLAEYAKSRGYEVPEDPEKIKELFGPGWWKYAPDVAEQLLLRNGFSRDEDGKWLLPDETPWKITIIGGPNLSHGNYRNPLAAAQQWRNFGIDVQVVASESMGTLAGLGNYQVSGVWPAMEPWGGHPDLYRTFSVWHSRYYKPIGELAIGNGAQSRWKDPRMDKIVEEIEKIDWDDPRNIELGIEGLKIAVEEMPTIPVTIHPRVITYNEYYWTNYPTAENLYGAPDPSFPNLKYVLPFLEPVER